MMKTQGFPNAEMTESRIKMFKGLKHAAPLASPTVRLAGKKL